jgi:hypothetical protein
MFQNARMKVERAQRHVADLESDLASFFENNKVRCTFREDRVARKIVLDMDPPEPPAEWSMIVGDAFHCLRSALDHAAFDIVAPKGAAARATAFPFAIDKATLTKKNRAYRLIEKANKKAARVIRDTIKPTADGDRMLWFLHQIDNVDRHRKLITTACAVITLLPTLVDPTGNAFRNQAAGGMRVNKKLTVAVGPIGSRILGLPVFSPQLIFGEDGEFEGRSVQKAIAEGVDRVNYVLNVLEAACE